MLLKASRFQHLALLVFLILPCLFAACATEPTPAPVAAIPTPTAEPTVEPTFPPDFTATPAATTVAPLKTSEWGTVKSSGALLKSRPVSDAMTLEKLEPFTLVAWKNKLPDESWWERVDGGWVARNEVVIYTTEAEARKGLPQATATPAPPATPRPWYEPPTAKPATARPQPPAKPAANPAPAVAPAETTAGPTVAAGSEATATSTKAPVPPTTANAGATSCSPGQIKGNRKSKIYHMPGQRDYDKLSSNLECFNSEAEAQKAGYRKALR